MNLLAIFWQKYKERYQIYSGLTAGIFLLQIVHLYWLTARVVWPQLFGISFFNPNSFWQLVIILVDYIEIPAIIATSILYIFSLRQKWNTKDLVLLILLNSQWLHIFWISDEFVVDIFLSQTTSTILPFWLAWVAIVFDYLEIPVMYDATKKFIFSLVRTKEHGNNII